ncbi:efflux RND transporter periplasmic adaptor subunit [Idiomarina sp.]|uniref:efflux RND transporter periplasmic adaptor subunit n=1 Tax=Idiomarina sp. TaxID=1874361 RepID=UPI0025BD8C2C|nr:efflux RND transporter periplasmic adaptor subunit [Idiomarina sp.]NQZ05233.1 efflux RND transporter periplasmic adaptor subunit [Idiomarina sp.]
MKRFTWCLQVTALVSLLVASAGATAQSYGAREALVNVAPVQFENEKNRVEAVGTAEAQRAVTLFSPVSERVTQVNFEPGDRVQAGDLLVQLDDRREQVALRQAQISLKDAERTVERLKQSFAQGAVPQSELDNAILLRDLAEVEVDRVETEIADRKIIAPFDGIVGITDVEEGDRINEQTQIATIDDRDTLLINFQIPEAAVYLLKPGVTLEVEPWRYSGQPVNAEIVELDSRINPTTRMFRARAKVDNKNDDFLPGTSFRTAIELAGEEFASIPEVALSWGADNPYIWIAENSKAKRIEVQIEQRLEGRVLVSGNINRDDTLIVEGVQSLRDGQPIKYEMSELDASTEEVVE